MAEIAIARVTIGVVWKLFAPYTAQSLEQGDVSEEKIRQLLLSQFEKIHEHLNALRRKELVAAVAFLENGRYILSQFNHNICQTRTLIGIFYSFQQERY